MRYLSVRNETLKFSLSDLTLFRVTLPLQAWANPLAPGQTPVDAPQPPDEPLAEGSRGFMVRGLQINDTLPAISVTNSYVVYTVKQYRHCYIDLQQSFDDYLAKFSSKTRSTLKRKVKKFETHSGGRISWKMFATPADMSEFFALARKVSEKTYQERLLDAGIPDSDSFRREAEELAGKDQLRAYILFDGDRPVSYLYCPVEDDAVIYAYLGYDPDYSHLSVGTVLQWLATEQLLGEGKFRYFDFTEGESAHKLLFSTDQRLCANVIFLRRTFANSLLIHAHHTMDNLSRIAGNTLERLGVKAKIKRLLRSRA